MPKLDGLRNRKTIQNKNLSLSARTAQQAAFGKGPRLRSDESVDAGMDR